MSELVRTLPTGRVRRAARVGGLLGTEIGKAYATKAANLVRSPEDRTAATGRQRQEAAGHIVDVLGEMKGGAMKIGQMASMIDLGASASDDFNDFQAKLGELRDHAPQASFRDMRKVIEQDLGDRISNLFAEFDPDAAAAASIGQVYQARLHDGREVAVKVQYPGIGAAVRADLQNLGLMIRAAKRFAPGLDAQAMGLELRERVSEELDYEHEAQTQRAFARRWRGHPFIVIPDVISDMCRARVLVTEWVDGVGFERLKESPPATRDRVGETILRFFYGSLYRFGSVLRRPSSRQLSAVGRRPSRISGLRDDQGGSPLENRRRAIGAARRPRKRC